MIESSSPVALRIEYWPIERLVEYPRNPRKNDAAVDQMGGSIREFGFAIPVLARSSVKAFRLMVNRSVTWAE